MNLQNNNHGVFPVADAKSVSNKNMTQQAIDTLAEAILKATSTILTKLEKRIAKLEKVGTSEGSGSSGAVSDTAENSKRLGGILANEYALKTDTVANANLLGDKPPEYYAAAADVGMDLLWSNASITSAFPAQSIQIDLTAYRAVIIVFRQSESMPYRIGVFCEVGYYGVANFPVHKLRYRRFTVSESNVIEFNGAREYASYDASESSAADEANVIPVKIYGIK